MRDPEKGFGKTFSGPRVKRCGEYATQTMPLGHEGYFELKAIEN